MLLLKEARRVERRGQTGLVPENIIGFGAHFGEELASCDKKVPHCVGLQGGELVLKWHFVSDVLLRVDSIFIFLRRFAPKMKGVGKYDLTHDAVRLVVRHVKCGVYLKIGSDI